MDFAVGIGLGIIITILFLIFILCLVVLTSLQFASTNIDALAVKINDAIAKGEAAAKNTGGKGGAEGSETSPSALKNSSLFKSLLFDEIKGKYVLN